jgi:hypothetical protein
MPLWLIQFLPVAWKFLKHFGIYLLLAVVLVGGPFLLYRKGWHDGQRAKICPPTNTISAGGTQINNYKEDSFKIIGADLKCLFIKLRVGY